MASETPPEIEIVPPYLTEIPLEGEGGDRAFSTPSGMRLRVKLQVTDRRASRPLSGKEELAAPTSVTLTISLAELDEQNQVKTAGEKLRIFDVHEITLEDEQLSNPHFSIEEAVMGAIELKAKEAEAISEKRAETVDYLFSSWGVEF